MTLFDDPSTLFDDPSATFDEGAGAAGLRVWLRGGRVVRDSSGRVLRCGECPCPADTGTGTGTEAITTGTGTFDLTPVDNCNSCTYLPSVMRATVTSRTGYLATCTSMPDDFYFMRDPNDEPSWQGKSFAPVGVTDGVWYPSFACFGLSLLCLVGNWTVSGFGANPIDCASDLPDSPCGCFLPNYFTTFSGGFTSCYPDPTLGTFTFNYNSGACGFGTGSLVIELSDV